MQKPLILIFLAVFSLSVHAQSTTNLDVFYSLIDSSLMLLPKDIPNGSSVVISPSGNYLMYNFLHSRLDKKYNGISTGDRNIFLSFAVEEISLNYSEPFRKKFLGDFYIEREFSFSGNFVVLSSGVNRNFSYDFRDTVKLDDIKSLENNLYPFTSAEIPAEPFFQGIIEPVAAVTTAAAAVVLFFILRSK